MMNLGTLLKLHSVRWSIVLGTIVSGIGVLQANHVAIPQWVLIAVGLAGTVIVPAARNVSQPDVTS